MTAMYSQSIYVKSHIDRNTIFARNIIRKICLRGFIFVLQYAFLACLCIIYRSFQYIKVNNSKENQKNKSSFFAFPKLDFTNKSFEQFTYIVCPSVIPVFSHDLDTGSTAQGFIRGPVGVAHQLGNVVGQSPAPLGVNYIPAQPGIRRIDAATCKRSQFMIKYYIH